MLYSSLYLRAHNVRNIQYRQLITFNYSGTLFLCNCEMERAGREWSYRRFVDVLVMYAQALVSRLRKVTLIINVVTYDMAPGRDSLMNAGEGL